jgi:MoaA/NifB/PqqE/SkfB family radical SAM enzyme
MSLRNTIDTMTRKSLLIHELMPSRTYWSPVVFTISITNKCNLRCPMCSRTINGVENKHMDRELFVQASKYFNNKTINIVGNGEPFLHPNLFEFIGICQSRKAKMHIVTNATLLSKDLVKDLLKFPTVHELAISIDGTRDTYNKIRIGGDFDTTINNLKELSQARIHGPRLIVNFVSMQSNIQDLPELIEIVGNYVDAIRVIHPLCFSQEGFQEHLNSNIIRAKSIFTQSLIVAQKYNLEISFPQVGATASGCIYPWVAPNIGIDGDIYPCHIYGYLFGSADNTQKAIRIYDANIFETCHKAAGQMGNIVNFNNDWNGSKFKEFRKKLSNINCLSLKEKPMITGNFCSFCPNRWNSAS